MDILFGMVVILIAIIVANFLSQLMPKIPKAFWQILGGVILALIPGSLHQIRLEPDLFLMLVIAPLLFYEGQHTNASVLSKNFSSIIRLAGVLAVLTVVILGFTEQSLLHWVLPLTVALAAIVTPTDATALDSVTSGVEMPSGIKRALNLESLFNDASGLVILELALLWLNTGHFSFLSGFKEFLVAAFGGAIVGLVLGMFVVWLRQNLIRFQLDDYTAQILIQVISPIAIYLIAEHYLHVSGIIAVVIAGVVHNEERSRLQFISAKLSNLSNQVWEMISQVLNGIVFVLLGLELVRVVQTFIHTTGNGWIPMVGVGILMYLIMLAVRFLSMAFSRREDVQRFIDKGEQKKDAFVFAIGGVHGAMTMAMALSLPYTLNNGNAFPYRDNILLIATVVIILSLVVPLFVLPRVLPAVEPEFETEDFDKAHLEMISQGMDAVEDSSAAPQVKQQVTRQLQSQLGYGEEQLDRDVWEQAANRMQKVSNQAVEDAMDTDQLSSDAAMFYQRMSHNSRNGGWRGLQHRARVFWHKLEQLQMHWVDQHVSSERRKKRKQARIEKYIQRELKHLKHLPADQQEAVKARINEQREYLALDTTEDGRKDLKKLKQKQRERWSSAMKEIQKVVDPAVETDIQSIEQAGDDPRLAVAMRNMQIRQQNAIQNSFDSDVAEQEVMMDALQAELQYIQDGRENGSLNSGLAKALYDEVNAAQSLVLAIEKEEEE
ncbi:CPA1 family monovalent cation:H+ antiporter [Weissella uvarum]|uniref:cation:proton antiporter n=1 Tax=Weissella uvarum TaxID=1479233 RepID=UPI00195F587B|nr:sodium:proton antiporter [Weissella uvarum]MBM7618026.1 CPA1 family monovalent cation:H+ antiporter [Weissella uvarum]MCM0595117.1 sodium:proton antiporter [Weissella uvarum]